MQTKRRDLFVTVRTEGAMLPADLLQRVADRDPRLEGLTPRDYHRDGERLNECINRSWNRLLGCWKSFQTALGKLPANDHATRDTRERWLLPLFEELGYGRLQARKQPIMLGEQAELHYPVSHLWGHAPVHLIGWRVDLDRRTPGVADADKRSPHSWLQELLNRSEAHLWAFLSNGRKLRVLRDNASLTRQAYVEFDLEAMFQGEVYADFVLLWLLCHESRVADEPPANCWLERWSRAAHTEGARALDQLRDGVRTAIEALGRGFLAHPANARLKAELQEGRLKADDTAGDAGGYFQQLLRLVYRLLFLFVAEDRTQRDAEGAERGLLFLPGADPAAIDRYRKYYSTTRLRTLAAGQRGTPHTDLYHALCLVMGRLHEGGCPELGLPALGSFLWSPGAVAALAGCKLSNEHLLEAVRALAFTADRNVRRPVDYRNLGAEELGSVYEALLEYRPTLDVRTADFHLTVVEGSDRHATGTFYTPPSLIKCILDAALDPVLDDAARRERPTEAILALKVCDPACGSGHFLIAAAHRIARRLAAVRSGEDEPTPRDVRAALREVIGRCVYGVDVNPMAVELCKVALWMETLDPGKALSFLDHHIQCGNSLLGATPAQLAGGIPDEAFEAGEGDAKPYCRTWKARNKEFRAGVRDLFEDRPPWERQGDLARAIVGMEAIADDSVEGVRQRQERYRQLVQSGGYLSGHFLADVWCSAWLWNKTDAFDQPVTEREYRMVEKSPHDMVPWMRQEVQRLRDEGRFFHWHLAFPDVFRIPAKGERAENPHTGWSGGFDAVVGNPPWVRQELLRPIKKLLRTYEAFKSTADSSVYFLERGVQIARLGRRVGMLTPNKWFWTDYAEQLRVWLRDRTRTCLLVDFGHAKKLFIGADTFPAAVVLEPTSVRPTDDDRFHFVRAHDSDRKRYDLDYLIQHRAVDIPHRHLRADRWQLEDPRNSLLLDRLMATGTQLQPCVGTPLLRGVLTGLNEAFYVDGTTKAALLADHPKSEGLFKTFLRGRDIQRWICRWEDQWHIVIPSTQNQTWPWSECADEAQAEELFREHHPTIHQHLKPYEERLRNREDKGKFWWELRACDYYDAFARGNILIQTIVYHSQFSLDTVGHMVNNTGVLLPSKDLYLLAVLNSRVMWWILSRVMAPRKDEGLFFDVETLAKLPIPDCPEPLRRRIRDEVAVLLERLGSGVLALEERLRRERAINALVEEAFALTEPERALLYSSLPPRDPIAVLEEELTGEEGDGAAAALAGPVRTAHRLADLLGDGLPAEPFPLQIAVEDFGPGTPSLWTCRLLRPGDPRPEPGAMVVVRHRELRLGEEPVGIAAGVFRYTTLTDAETRQPVVNVFLRGRIPPGQLRLRQAEWEGWRPLAVLEPRG
jgi:hypothetical protein